jgi:hypothetical protein
MVWPEVALNWLFPYPLCVSVLGVPSLCLFVALPSQTDLGATPPCAGDRAVSEGDQVRCHPGRVGGDHGGLGDSASHEELPQKRRVQTVGSREAPNLHTSIYIPCWLLACTLYLERRILSVPDPRHSKGCGADARACVAAHQVESGRRGTGTRCVPATPRAGKIASWAACWLRSAAQRPSVTVQAQSLPCRGF